MYDSAPSFLELCAFEGICPNCCLVYAECRCEEDAELEAKAEAHPAGCLCCVASETAPADRARVLELLEFALRHSPQAVVALLPPGFEAQLVADLDQAGAFES